MRLLIIFRTIWFDLFSNNQHKAPAREFHWWQNTFQDSIRSIGKTVMVLAPWNNPVPLTRGWCIWELYSTITTSSEFDVALSHRSRMEFIHDIDADPTNAV